MKFMLYTTNTDTPGYIGALGSKLGDLGINIATFALGRAQKSGEAIALLGVDEPVAPEALNQIAALPQDTTGQGAAVLTGENSYLQTSSRTGIERAPVKTDPSGLAL